MSKISGRAALLITVVAAILVILIGWFALVSPQRSKADSLDTQIATAESQLAEAQHVLATPNRQHTKAALAAAEKALPDTPETSAILRQLSSLVSGTKVELDTIGPGVVPTTGGAEPYALSLSVKGQFFAVQDFLKRLRESADIKNDQIVGGGRLYSVDGISFSGGTTATGTNVVTATISLNAYVYAPPPPPPTTTTTTTTTTTDTTTTAAGASP